MLDGNGLRPPLPLPGNTPLGAESMNNAVANPSRKGLTWRLKRRHDGVVSCLPKAWIDELQKNIVEKLTVAARFTSHLPDSTQTEKRTSSSSPPRPAKRTVPTPSASNRRCPHLLREPAPNSSSLIFLHESLTEKVDDDRPATCRTTGAAELEISTLLTEIPKIRALDCNCPCHQSSTTRSTNPRPRRKQPRSSDDLL